MNRHFRSVTMVGVSLGMLFVAGCSDDDDGLTATDFREQSNAICSQGDQDLFAAAGPVFGNDAATSDELQAALDAIVSITNRQLDDIEALDAPSDLKDGLTEFIAEGRSATDEAESQGLGFFESDDDPWVRIAELALGLGLDACGGE